MWLHFKIKYRIILDTVLIGRKKRAKSYWENNTEKLTQKICKRFGGVLMGIYSIVVFKNKKIKVKWKNENWLMRCHALWKTVASGATYRTRFRCIQRFKNKLWENICAALVEKTRVDAGCKVEPSYRIINSQSVKTRGTVDESGYLQRKNERM